MKVVFSVYEASFSIREDPEFNWVLLAYFENGLVSNGLILADTANRVLLRDVLHVSGISPRHLAPVSGNGLRGYRLTRDELGIVMESLGEDLGDYRLNEYGVPYKRQAC